MTRLQGNNPNRIILVVGTLIAVVLIALALFAVRDKPAAGAGKGLSANFKLDGVPFIGKADAPVNIVTIEDFKCPVCKQFTESIEPELKTKYVDTGKAKIYTLIWPFLAQNARLPTDDSKLAGQAALCVFDDGGNDAFESFKNILFRAQGDETTVWATKTRLKDLAGSVEGIDQTKFATCLDTDATAARVDAMEKQSVDAGVNSTPTIFVNGKQVLAASGQGSYSPDDIGKAVDAAQQ
ncbi:DsbA family protein [Deinococcus sp. AJ005]|uniref:DsbA family protein n=1 Tax=Deinococcus sp. AJ005 TaxID=2652443 RepID=UPI00125CB81C|nr:DsbA family protein [Deinococcus sp. AJ005]QFP76592.1 thioredoxin domain-containing protein [Deinococcus sp. AJ005]